MKCMGKGKRYNGICEPFNGQVLGEINRRFREFFV
jgi:hypothetical protein